MSNPAFIVDGFTEKLILHRICPGQPVRRIDNGKDVSISKIAERVASHIRTFGNKYYPIVILIDREERTATSSQLCIELEKELRNLNITDELIIGFKDRMIENWILADWETFSANIDPPPVRPAAIEGKGGKGLLKKFKEDYQETTDGVELFLAARPEVMAQHSPSFKDFADKLKKIQCWWIENMKGE